MKEKTLKVNKHPYTWAQFDKDILKLVSLIKEKEYHIDGIICIYRGSLSMGTILSNLLNLPLSIIKFQTRDGSDKIPEFIIDVRTKPNGNYLIVDDIIDSGFTIESIINFINKDITEDELKPFLYIASLFGDFLHIDKIRNVKFIKTSREIPGWVIFPWEKINTVRCKDCGYGEACNEDPIDKTHCHCHNLSFFNHHHCAWGTIHVPKISKIKPIQNG